MSGGFLERWSRRKADEGQAAQDPDKVAPVATDPIPEPDTPPSLGDEELAALPRIEDLTPESSLAPFLRAGVPSGLKNAAMRKMWLLTPAIRDHKDCAVDYHWDWNTPGGVPGAGGRLDPGAVQKMLRGLTDPPPAPASETAPTPDTTTESTPETPTGERTATADDPQIAAARAPSSAPPSAGSRTEATNSEPHKRHGGAMPS